MLESRDDIVPHGVSLSMHRYKKIAKVIVKVYTEECAQLVYDGLKAEINQELDRGLNMDDGWQEERLRILEAWKRLDNPFSGGNQCLAFLLQALSSSQQTMVPTLPPASPPRSSMHDFAES